MSIGKNSIQSESVVPSVYLIGAGPGDPDLLTVKAARLLERADVLVYDRLVSDEIMTMVPAGVTRIFVGKASGRHSVPQDEINVLLVRLARAGRRVVRLKGGDPFIFGRGSEEALYLRRNGISYEVVPGITAAAGCSAAAGIPLTHRGLASGVRFVTGHCRDDGTLDLNWRSLADPDTTLVIYMGLANIDEIAERLIDAGLAGGTPAAAIACGTTDDQHVMRTRLGDLAADIARHNLEAPVTIVIGRVAGITEIAKIAEIADQERIDERASSV